MKKIKIKVKGICPMLHNRFPLEEHGENKSKSKKKVYVPQEEAKKKLYQNENRELYIPSEHIFSAMIKAASSFKFEGKKTYKDIIKGGIIVEPDCIPLDANWEIDTRAVVIQRARVPCWRPKFNEWDAEFTISIIDDENVNVSVLKEILDKAGMVGIGDYRPRFGRFQVIKFEELK